MQDLRRETVEYLGRKGNNWKEKLMSLKLLIKTKYQRFVQGQK
jgi:hypothetical protein